MKKREMVTRIALARDLVPGEYEALCRMPLEAVEAEYLTSELLLP